MHKFTIKKLFEKYIQQECTKDEIQQIVTYLRKSEDLEGFPTIESVSQFLQRYPDLEEATANRLYAKIIQSKKKKIRFRKIALVAALFILLPSLAFLYQSASNNRVTQELLTPKNESITLKTNNGTVKEIDEKEHSDLFDINGNLVGQQNGSQLVYHNSSNTPEKLVYNTLTVPYGKHFDVLLSDGTKVYINSGTSLKYPVKFIKGKKRQVFLKGEAFFDVAENKEVPFVVNTEELNIQVLGTEFNVSNYPEDTNSNVVLIEGSVAMYQNEETFSNTKNIILSPGTKGSFDKINGDMTVRKVNTSIYTSWMEGHLIFRNMALGNILKKLERHYNVKIENRDMELDKEIFNAGFNNESINEILEAFEETYKINYTIENNKVIIK